MKLRWFATCNRDGVWSESCLQYWDEDNRRWEDVPRVECKTWEEEEYLTREET